MAFQRIRLSACVLAQAQHAQNILYPTLSLCRKIFLAHTQHGAQDGDVLVRNAFIEKRTGKQFHLHYKLSVL